LEAEFVFELGERKAKILYRALKVEELDAISKAKVYLEGGRLMLRLEAEELADLRAAVNAWLRLIKACLEVL